MKTPLCDRLGIEVPIVLAGMGGASGPALVAAVSNAGGLGILGAVGMSPDEVRAAIREIRALTPRPFGVNVLLAPPEPGNRDAAAAQRELDPLRAALGLPPGAPELELPPLDGTMHVLAAILDERAPILSVGLGDPAPIAAAAHAAGCTVIAMVTSVDDARRAVAGGADLVMAQGAEAGGHRSTFAAGEPALVGTLALVPQVVDAVSVPVLAAGGIADGRGVAAALVLGAQAAVVGTRFLVARESPIFPAWKQRLLAAAETDTIVTRAATGRPARMLRNGLTDAVQAPLAWPLQRFAAADLYAAAAARDDADRAPLYAGQATRLLRADQPAAEIMAELVRDARAALGRFSPQPD